MSKQIIIKQVGANCYSFKITDSESKLRNNILDLLLEVSKPHLEIKPLVVPKIADLKNQVAAENGYNLQIKDKWEYAMRVTNRTNRQIDLYEQLIAKLLSNFSA